MKRDYAPQSDDQSLGISRDSHDYYAVHARQWRNRVGLAVFLVVLLFWGYTLFATPFFEVQTLTITGISRLPKTDVEKQIEQFFQTRRWGIFSQKNIFILNATALRNVFNNDARIAKISIQKNYQARSLALTIEERVPLYIMSFSDRAFAIDKEGIALIPLSVPVPQGTLPVIMDRRERTGGLGERVVPQNEMELLRTFHDELTRIAPFRAVAIGEPSPDAVTFTTEEGWNLYVNIGDSAQAQLKRLRVLLTTKIKPERRKKLDYIDLRFQERVYYK